MKHLSKQIYFTALALLLTTGCWRSSSSGDGDDLGSDADRDSDSAGDTGTGTAVETESYEGRETATAKDTEPDSATGTSEPPGTDTDSPQETGVDPETGSLTEHNTDTDTHSETGTLPEDTGIPGETDTPQETDTPSAVDSTGDTETLTEPETDTGEDNYCDSHWCPTVLPTGQTRCFDTEGVEQDPCPGTAGAAGCGATLGCGQDAQYGHEYPPRVFTEETIGGETVVTDSWTGLVWQQDRTDDLTWQEAMDYCEALSYAGYDDWRLPTYHELTDLIDFSMYGPATGFPGLSDDIERHWTSSRYYEGVAGMFVDLQSGGAGHNLSYEEEINSLRCVRNGLIETEAGEDRYRELGSEKGLVRDKATGIIWYKGGGDLRLSWYDALSFCESLEYEGYDDWRLPDINELRSLVTIEKAIPEDPMLQDPCSHFPGISGNRYWSSTSFLRITESYKITENARQIEFSRGFITSDSKDDDLRDILCLRYSQ